MSKARDSVEDLRTIDAVTATADAALPKAGGTMTGVIAGFESTGIDDNATSTAITIDANENVGIGVTPEYWNNTYRQALQIGHSVSLSAHKSTNILVLANNAYYDGNDTRWEYINSGEEAAQIEMTAGGAITFDVAPSGTADSAISWTTAMTINNSGSVLVGTTAAFGSGRVCFDGGNNDSVPLNTRVTQTTNASQIGFWNGNGGVGSIQTNGSSTSYNTSSDYRLKTDVQPMTGATDRVKLLKPCNFEWIVDGTRVDGFIAHEAQEVVPEAVVGTKDAMRDEEYEVTPAVLDDEGNETTAAVMGTRSVPDMQGIDQSKLVPLLTATIQELIARIEALEAI